MGHPTSLLLLEYLYAHLHYCHIMNDLVPERRIDRNGFWSTKYVRQDMVSKRLSTPLPSPVLPTTHTTSLDAPIEAIYPYQVRPTQHHYYGPKFKPRERLLKYLVEIDGRYQNNGVSSYSVTDVEAYSVLKSVLPKDALLLLDYGVRSGSAAREIMSDAGLSKFIGDYSAPVNQAVTLSCSSIDFITAFPANSRLLYEDPQAYVQKVQSVAEGVMSKKVETGDDNSSTTLRALVDADAISVDHIRVIKASRLYDALDSNGTLISELKRMHKGDSLLAPEDIDEFIDLFGLSKDGVCRNSKSEVYALSGTYGPDYVRRIPKTQAAIMESHWYHEMAEMRGYDSDTSQRFIAFSIALARVTGKYMPLELSDRWDLFESELPPSALGRKLKDGMTVEQIMGIEKHGIAPSMSTGWL